MGCSGSREETRFTESSNSILMMTQYYAKARTISDNRKPALVRLFRVPTRGARPRASDFGRPSYALAIRDPPRPEKQPNIKRRRGPCVTGDGASAASDGRRAMLMGIRAEKGRALAPTLTRLRAIPHPHRSPAQRFTSCSSDYRRTLSAHVPGLPRRRRAATSTGLPRGPP